ncbi:MAG: hypothetical protein FWB86_05195 [Treponema sp.]|nr:hypothetical protein [Treponema sp.]MCL2251061.1 hypothetical protein [Treponema sp.]
MTITQTVEIPDSRKLIIDVPREVPTGSVVLSFTPAEEVENPNRKPISKFFNIISPNTYGDGVTYQRKLRDEWDD